MNYRKTLKSELTPDQEEEYHMLNKAYHKVSGKWFKRNGREMAQGFDKLEAIKMRLGMVESKINSHNSDFNLGGAL